jgi:hypothetical protein
MRRGDAIGRAVRLREEMAFEGCGEVQGVCEVKYGTVLSGVEGV